MYTLKSREIALNEEYDVIVAGGGPAGCAAAIAAAREGAKTLLIEASGFLGGMATAAYVNAWTPYSDGQRIIYGGLSQKVFQTLKSKMPHVDKDATNWVPIDYEALKRIYDEMVLGAGAQILFNSTLCAVDMKDENTVDTIIVNNKAGLTAYRAKVFIDCTGDADLCAWAGAEYEKGSEDGELQPCSHCFVMSNVDHYGYVNSATRPLHPGNKNSVIHPIVESGKYGIPDKHICNDFIGPGTMGFNAGHLWDVDNTDPVSVSAALVAGRKMAYEYKKALSQNHPAFANIHLVATGTLIGARESRRIIGDYYFTIDDFLQRKTFPDEILRNNYFVDIHNTEKEGKKQQKTSGEEWHSDDRYDRYKDGESHGLPYRCLTPKTLNNVLVAGRTVSTDRITQGSLRVMPSCLCMGEAAGIAAKLAAEGDANVHNVDTQRLRKRLVEEGAYLP